MHRPPGRSKKNTRHLCDINTTDAETGSHPEETANKANGGTVCKVNWPVIVKDVKVTKGREGEKLFQTEET